jgi:predicted house-cleaning noncanonical NTP pyrophosphatase (MazG superfamily)
LHDRRFDDPFLAAYRPVVIKKPDTQPIIINEEALITKYKSAWDSVQLKTSSGIPQYATYIDELDKITEQISKYTKKPDAKLSKLEELRLQLMNSKKHKEAIANYFTYGQPASLAEITEPCKQALSLTNKTDVEIIKAEIKKPSKTGWVVLISYKIKGSTWVIDALKTNTFEVSYNPVTKSYTATQEK